MEQLPRVRGPARQGMALREALRHHGLPVSLQPGLRAPTGACLAGGPRRARGNTAQCAQEQVKPWGVMNCVVSAEGSARVN